jgi:hypothetical protein
MDDFFLFQDFLLEIVWDENGQDSWTFSWGNANYSSKKAYNVLIGTEQASPLFQWLWDQVIWVSTSSFSGSFFETG